jgi:hypothetical protein
MIEIRSCYDYDYDYDYDYERFIRLQKAALALASIGSLA